VKDVITVAAVRAVLGGLVLGGLGFLAIWSQTTDERILAIAFAQPFLTYIGLRLGIEGVYDASKKPAAPGETEVRAEPPLG
jgi:hypothetical protein